MRRPNGGIGDLPGCFATNKAFDEVLEAACPDNFITAALAPVQIHARRLWYSAGTHERMGGSITMHVQAIDAIRRGDADKASSAMAALVDYLNNA
jgi:DNA-binding GntR family transcriptional regulator